MAPALSRLEEERPGLQVRLEVFDRLVDEAGEGFDLDVRVDDEIEPRLIARRLADNHRVLCAAPAYLQRKGMPRTPEDLAGHDHLRDSSAPVRAQMGPGRKLRLQSLRPGVPDAEVEAPAVLQSVSTELLMRAGVDGMGVVVTSRLLAEEHLARGELVHVLPDWIFSRYTIYAALPSGRMLPARTRMFLDFLSEQVPLAMAEQAGLAQPS